MTPEERIEEVKMAIHQPLIAYLNDKISLFEATEQILNLKDSKGKMIGIISEDQSLPLNPIRTVMYDTNVFKVGRKSGYSEAQQDILNQGWRRIIEGGKE